MPESTAVEAAAPPQYIAVIPAYNEIGTVRSVVRRTLAQGLPVIVVDDGSTDDTTAAIADLPVQLLRNPHNAGKAASLWRGIECAIEQGAQAIVTLDADGQHFPEDIPALIAAYRRAPGQIVIGSRLHAREQIPRARYCANRFANFWVAWASGYPIRDSQSGFRIYPVELFQQVQPRRDRAASFVFESEILIEAGRRGIRSIAVPVSVSYGAHHRRSYFRPVLDIARITCMLTRKIVGRGFYPAGLLRSLRRDDRAQLYTNDEEHGR